MVQRPDCNGERAIGRLSWRPRRYSPLPVSIASSSANSSDNCVGLPLAFWSIGVCDRPQGERLLACGLQALKCDPRLKRLPSRKLPAQLKRPSKFAVRADLIYAASVDLFDGATDGREW